MLKIFAHRGIFDHYPENSYEALRIAISNGFSVETDVRLARERDLVIIHDDRLQRLCGKDTTIGSLSLVELQQQHYINSEGKETSNRLISFRQYCELVVNASTEPETAVHLKSDSQTEEGLRTVSGYFEEFNLYARGFVFDLTLQAATTLRKMNPKIKIALIVSEYKFEPTVHLWNEVKDFDFEIVWSAEYRKFYSRELIDEVKGTGRTFYAVSPDVHKAPHILHLRAYKDYEQTWDDLIRWGAEGICTDLPFNLRRRSAIGYNDQ